MERTLRRSALLALLAGLAASCATAPGGSSGQRALGDKAGGPAAPIVLTLGTNDGPGDASGAYIEQFAADLARISGGLVTIETRHRAAGEDVVHYDQRVAEMVRRGDVDLGVVPARAFDELGVTSLQALQAPFLLTGDEALDAVVTGRLRDDLMSGLPAAGYEGLALWPDELRHPFSFGAPILKLGDFQGLSLLSPFARRSWDLMGALGARPQDPNDRTVMADGAEAGYRSTANVNRPGVITGNVTFYPKIQALIAGGSSFSRLDDEQQQFVREAAAATTAWVVEHRQHEDIAAATYCRSGGVVVLADASDRAAIEAAAAPVYADLEADPLTTRLIGEIRDIVVAPRIPPFVAYPCGSPATVSPTANASTAPGPTDDPAVLNGIYRADISEAFLVTAGINPSDAYSNGGIFTLTFKNGRFTHHLSRDDSTCTGTYTVRGSRVVVSCSFADGQTFSPLFSAGWTLADGALRFTQVEPPNDLLAQAMWGGKPFVRIADAP